MKNFLIFFAFFLSACSSSPKYIDDTTLKSIFLDLAMHDVVMIKMFKEIKRDTTYFFKPVLEKHNVTIEDLEYTLEKKILRKSNVLPELLSELTSDVAKLKEQYNYKSKLLDDWDERADSVFMRQVFLDSLEIYDVDSIKNSIVKINLDETGSLSVKMVYSIDSLDKNRSYSMILDLKDTISGKTTNGTTRWLTKRNGKNDSSSATMSVGYDAKEYNQAIITFLSGRSSRKDNILDKPYVKIDTMEITFHYPKLVARQKLIDSVLNIPSFKRKLEIVYEKKDSSPLSTFLK